MVIITSNYDTYICEYTCCKKPKCQPFCVLVATNTVSSCSPHLCLYIYMYTLYYVYMHSDET